MPTPPGGELRIHLVRHAETLFNVRHQLQGWCDSPLTPRGELQIAALGEHFREIPLVAAFSSDFTRTRTTAHAALAGHASIEPVFTPALREWNFGGWEGQANSALWVPLFERHGFTYGSAGHWDELTADGPDTVLDALAASDPSGLAEDAASVNERLRAAIALITAVPAGDVLVVTHGAVLQSLVPLLVPGARVAPGYPNCGVTTVTLPADRTAGAVGTVGDLDATCAGDPPVPPLALP
ncbi:histidine phosphatase family protein [Herbiconiux liukaitaii]|uniref:histidine phosphatase family protein n=1 Tax=Herbiconiux liukaitaii TaxID=3342799 RepID=UPI0035B996C8